MRITIAAPTVVAVAAGALAATTAVDTATAPAGAAPARPNVIVIMTDDMRKDDLGAMPDTVRLLGGNNGARYADAYVSTPLCCPSRATFLTGQYPHNNGVHDNTGSDGGVDAFADAETLPVWLQDAGYQTVMLGKYLNGYGDPTDGVERTYIPPGWDHWAALSEPTNSNYTDFDVTVGSSATGAPGVGKVGHVANGYQTSYFTGRAVSRITSVPSDQPMFMWLSYFAPHGGRGDYPHRTVPVPVQYRGMSQVGMPDSPAVDEAQVGDKPPWIRNLPRLTDKVERQILTQRRERRDALAVVDDGVAKIVAALRAAGELDNTVIVFTSDNGYLQGEHRIPKEKSVPYLESARVPLLIRGRGFAPGTHSEPVSNVDLAPTIADLAGVTPGLPVDGMSLLDAIPADRSILVEYLGAATEIGMPSYSSVVQNDTQYTEYAGGSRELYDLAEDPWQLQNRISDAALRSERRSLAAELDRLRSCAGEGCRG